MQTRPTSTPLISVVRDTGLQSMPRCVSLSARSSIPVHATRSVVSCESKDLANAASDDRLSRLASVSPHRAALLNGGLSDGKP